MSTKLTELYLPSAKMKGICITLLTFHCTVEDADPKEGEDTASHWSFRTEPNKPRSLASTIDRPGRLKRRLS